MAIQVVGNGGIVAEVDTTFKSVRTTIRPPESINWNCMGGVSGALTGVAAAGPIFSFRNTGTNLIIVRRVTIGFVTTTAFTTAQGLTFLRRQALVSRILAAPPFIQRAKISYARALLILHLLQILGSQAQPLSQLVLERCKLFL
jgi:hypothetical protein